VESLISNKLIIVAIATILLAAWPRFIGNDDLPNSSNASAIRKQAAELYEDMNAEPLERLRRLILVQRVQFHDFGHIPGSCSGYADKPEQPPRDDTIQFTEVGPFGVPLSTRNVVCAGRMPLRGEIKVLPKAPPVPAPFRSQ
jgi:hypothetical protein